MPEKTSWSNADLTPAARRKRLGLDEQPSGDVNPLDYGKGGHVAPDEGLSEFDRIMADSKKGLKQADDFFTPIHAQGENAKGAVEQKYDNSYGNTLLKHVGTNLAAIPGAVVPGAIAGLKAAISMPVQGYAELAHLADAVQNDPGLLAQLATEQGRGELGLQAGKNLVGDAGSALTELSNSDTAGGELVGSAIGATLAPEAGLAALTKGPGLAGRALGATGRAATRAGNSAALKATQRFAGPTAIFGHPLAAATEVLMPPALRGLGGAMERGGSALEGLDIPGALTKIGNTRIPNPFEHVLTPEEQAAASVRATVDTARGHVAKGASRAQADQKAGWPLGRSTAEKHTTPGADVRAHWPYEPAVRGQAGNVIQEGRGTSLDGLRKATEKKNASPIGMVDDLAGVRKPERKDLFDEYQASTAGPVAPFEMDGAQYADNGTGSHTRVQKPLDSLSALEAMQGGDAFLEGAGTGAKNPYFAGDVLNQEGSQRYLAEQSAKNAPVATAVQDASDAAETERLISALRKHQAAGDATFDTHLTGPEVDLTEQSRDINARKLSQLSKRRRQKAGYQ